MFQEHAVRITGIAGLPEQTHLEYRITTKTILIELCLLHPSCGL